MRAEAYHRGDVGAGASGDCLLQSISISGFPGYTKPAGSYRHRNIVNATHDLQRSNLRSFTSLRDAGMEYGCARGESRWQARRLAGAQDEARNRRLERGPVLAEKTVMALHPAFPRLQDAEALIFVNGAGGDRRLLSTTPSPITSVSMPSPTESWMSQRRVSSCAAIVPTFSMRTK